MAPISASDSASTASASRYRRRIRPYSAADGMTQADGREAVFERLAQRVGDCPDAVGIIGQPHRGHPAGMFAGKPAALRVVAPDRGALPGLVGDAGQAAGEAGRKCFVLFQIVTVNNNAITQAWPHHSFWPRHRTSGELLSGNRVCTALIHRSHMTASHAPT